MSFKTTAVDHRQGMGTRMHYGHPDFVDGFWARNRGGMSPSVVEARRGRSDEFKTPGFVTFSYGG